MIDIFQLPKALVQAFFTVIGKGVEEQLDAMSNSANVFHQEQGLIDL